MVKLSDNVAKLKQWSYLDWHDAKICVISLLCMLPLQYLNQLHYKVQLTVGVHLLNEENNVRVLHSPQDGHLILDHVLLREKREAQWSCS